MIALNINDNEVSEVAEKLYRDLELAGIEVLFDDREDAAAGVKFNDAALIGLPVRLVGSPRNLKGGKVVIKGRIDSESGSVALDDVLVSVQEVLASLAK